MPDVDVQESLADSARMSAAESLRALGTSERGLTSAEAARRLRMLGPNAVRTHKASGWTVLGRQLNSPILILLIITAAVALRDGGARQIDVIELVPGDVVQLGLGGIVPADIRLLRCCSRSRSA